LYASGYKRSEIAKILVKQLTPMTTGDEAKLRRAKRKLAMWEKDEKFRDLIYANGLIDVELQSGRIMAGVVKKAKRGRVDAARLAFELTGDTIHAVIRHPQP
jgi:EAL domain-containing protein (putative c-di-GMP-specific phosphodiesterase class I)